MFIAIFALSLVAASDLHVVQHQYHDDDGDMIRKSYHYFEKDYMENENRYPVYDYRAGYTHRTSKQYLDDQDWHKYDYDEEKRYDRNYRKAKRYNDDWKYSYKHRDSIDLDDWDSYSWKKSKYSDWNDKWKGSYSYKYTPWLGETQKTKCYNSAPEGKLFYIKC